MSVNPETVVHEVRNFNSLLSPCAGGNGNEIEHKAKNIVSIIAALAAGILVAMGTFFTLFTSVGIGLCISTVVVLGAASGVGVFFLFRAKFNQMKGNNSEVEKVKKEVQESIAKCDETVKEAKVNAEKRMKERKADLKSRIAETQNKMCEYEKQNSEKQQQLEKEFEDLSTKIKNRKQENTKISSEICQLKNKDETEKNMDKIKYLRTRLKYLMKSLENDELLIEGIKNQKKQMEEASELFFKNIRFSITQSAKLLTSGLSKEQTQRFLSSYYSEFPEFKEI